jgi:hypothetical protein
MAAGARADALVWSAITAVLMFELAFGKTRVGDALNNPVVRRWSGRGIRPGRVGRGWRPC